MNNNHDVETYNNGHGDRIAFVFQGVMRVLTIEQAKALKESLEYGLAKAHLTKKSSGREKVGDIWTNEDESAEIERQIIEDARR